VTDNRRGPVNEVETTGAMEAGAAPVRRQVAFRAGFVWVPLAAAIFAGFGLAAHLSFVIGFGFQLGPAFPALVQAHGHAQLVGWAGMFVMGVSLHFIPRLASVPLTHPRWVGAILWLTGTGLALRIVGQLVLAYGVGPVPLDVLRWLVVASGILEGAGILLYLVLVIGSVRGTGDIRTQPAFGAVRPFFGMMVVGWLVYASVNLIGLVDMGLRGRASVNHAWNAFAVQSFIDLVLLPVAMAFSVRLFPMFLALSAAFWPVRGTAYAYLVGACLQLVTPVLAPFGLEGRARDLIVGFGGLTKGCVILWFVWGLDLLTRRRPVERPARFLQIGPERPPTRPGLPDFGEFGRFELLVYSAYLWLVGAALYEIANGAGILMDGSVVVGPSVVRHMYLLGFITLLIFGVSVRMLPGFVNKRAVALPALVLATFWLGNTAALFRVIPLILPVLVTDLTPAVGRLAQCAFGLSGILALAAVILLSINLVWTLQSRG
jgi:uncharacterized protein involved in response to NO